MEKLDDENSNGEEKMVPRNYQLELMNIAVKQNTILFLPTGSGKTFIAVMVMKKLGEALDKPYAEGGKLCIMAVNTVALAEQQAEYIVRHTHFSVGHYIGDMNVDNWNKEMWNAEFNKNQVLVMTSQILVNIVSTGILDLNRVNFLIFDECHSGVSNQQMRHTMKFFKNLVTPPRILGLTATILNKNVPLYKVMNELVALENTYNSKIASVQELQQVVGYSTQPREEVATFNENELSLFEANIKVEIEALIIILESFKAQLKAEKPVIPNPNWKPLSKPDNPCKDLINLIKDILIHIDMFGSYGGSLAVKFALVQINVVKKNCDEPKLFNLLLAVESTLSRVYEKFKQHMENTETEREKIYSYSSDKIIKLLYSLKCINNHQLFCGIIFVERRFTAKILYHILEAVKSNDKSFDFIKPNFVVRPTERIATRQSLYKTKTLKKVVSMFRNKELNLLVSTSVLEEGIDIPMCSFVLQFDAPKDFRAYVQSKGRCRHKEGLYKVLISENDAESFIQRYREYQRIEQFLNAYLIGTNEQREGTNEKGMEEKYNEDIVKPYYVNGISGACVDQLSAISLLSMYCSSLSADIYTTLKPEFYYETKLEKDNNLQYKIHIQLPTVCPIKDAISSFWVPNKTIGKQVSAYAACIALHKCGELSDMLLPLKKFDTPLTNFLFTHWPKEKSTKQFGGKYQICYDKKIPDVCKGAISSQESVYLHIINFEPKLKPNNEIFHELISSDLSYGIVTSKPLYEVCDFPLYITPGEVNASLLMNVKKVSLTENQIMQIRSFHHLVFNDILELVKHYTFLHKNEDHATWLIVPVLKKEKCIDFNVIINNRKIFDQRAEPTGEEILKLVVNDETYLKKIVTPWYRGDSTLYVVTEVCKDLNAYSPFGNNDYASYVDYFKTKYHTSIRNPSLPLLLVKRISTRLNCINQRFITSKASKKEEREDFLEHLLPELCVKQEFPSCLWYQARLLPSFFFRIYNLLRIEEFRRSLVSETKIGVLDLPTKIHSLKPVFSSDHFLIDEQKMNAIQDVEMLDVNEMSVDVVDEAPPQNNVNVVALKRNIELRLLDMQYPWNDYEEPVDIERNLDVSQLDIIHYVNFMKEKEVTLEVKQHQVLDTLNVDKDFKHKSIMLLKKHSNEGPDLCDFYKALTATRAHEIVNYERLETLGDSFLKYIASLYIILKYPRFDEGKATTLKSKLVSNENLYYIALKKDLPAIMQYWEFQPTSEWCSPSYCVPEVLKKKIKDKTLPSMSLYNFDIPPEEQLSGEISANTFNSLDEDIEIGIEEEKYKLSISNFLDCHYIPNKNISDVVEALLGVYFEAGGFHCASKMIGWFGIIPESENDIFKQPVPEPLIDLTASQERIDFHIPSWRIIEQKLGYHFANRAYLLQALTHSSYTTNRITNCYQRLEFLGDAVLDFLITTHIYESYVDLSPGDLTDLRAALVNNVTFACMTVRHGFQKFFLSFNELLDKCINKFVSYQEIKKHVVNDDVITLLNEDDIELGENIDVPKVLGDIFEALAGAVFLDSGKDLTVVWQVFYKILWKEIDAFSKNIPKNPVRQIYEWKGANPKFQKSKVMDNGKVMTQLDFMINGEFKTVYGVGDNSKNSKKCAAKVALRLLS